MLINCKHLMVMLNTISSDPRSDLSNRSLSCCRYETFWDLQLPLAKEKQTGNWLSTKTTPASIMDCLAEYTKDEIMQVGVTCCTVATCALSSSSFAVFTLGQLHR